MHSTIGLTPPSTALREYVQLLHVVATTDPGRPSRHDASVIAPQMAEAALKAGLIGGNGYRDATGTYRIEGAFITAEGAKCLFEWTALLERDTIKHKLLTWVEALFFLAAGAVLSAAPQMLSGPDTVNCTPPAVTAPAPTSPART